MNLHINISEGGDDAKKKRKKRKGRGKGSQKLQTDPPSIPIAELFPDGEYLTHGISVC
jgi:methionyl aminopeptidase